MGRWCELEQRGHPSAVTHRKWKVQPSQVPSGHLLGRGKKERVHVVVTLQSGEYSPSESTDPPGSGYRDSGIPKVDHPKELSTHDSRRPWGSPNLPRGLLCFTA